MKVNNRQLIILSNDLPDFEGRLHFKKVLTNHSNENRGFKERWFKLKYNMLFYFKILDGYQLVKEPAGVLVLENSEIHYEAKGEVPFCFSITFRNEPEIKYLFSARSEDVVSSWITQLKNATYGSLRSKLFELQMRLNKTEKLSSGRTDLCQPKIQNQASTNYLNHELQDVVGIFSNLRLNSMSETVVDLNKNTGSTGKKDKEENLITF